MAVFRQAWANSNLRRLFEPCSSIPGFAQSDSSFWAFLRFSFGIYFFSGVSKSKYIFIDFCFLLANSCLTVKQGLHVVVHLRFQPDL